jgi:hypothetical protein
MGVHVRVMLRQFLLNSSLSSPFPHGSVGTGNMLHTIVVRQSNAVPNWSSDYSDLCRDAKKIIRLMSQLQLLDTSD